MKIDYKEITVRELANDYQDNAENGVVGYGGKLDIRPPYQYVHGDFSIKGLAFHNLPNDKQEQILNYKLTVYFCSGEPSEKLEWFETINIAGKELTKQELRNAVYVGIQVVFPKYRKEKHLSIRAFANSQKRETYERQEGICARCGANFELTEMEADHITPWHEGGKTSAENCQMLCRECNRRKSGK
jgi:hypothetical protein